MKKILLFISFAISFSAVFAQKLSDGFYRVYNQAELRYIYVTDNTGSASSITNIDLNAVYLIKGLEKTISDPATVLYVKNMSGDSYDVQTQGTSIYQLVGMVPTITTRDGVAYTISGSYGGATVRLGCKNSNSITYGGLSTDGSNPLWIFDPIVANSDNYFGITPSVEVGGKYYQPFFAEFAFSFASSGMKAYYVCDTKDGYAKLVEIKDKTIPGKTPVIIECSSKNPADNRLELKAGEFSSPSDNILKGVYFCNKYRGNSKDAVTKNDKKIMRVLGVTADGKLGFVTSEDKYIAANTFYLPVESGTPATLEAVADFPADPVAVEAVSIDKTSAELLVGESVALTATVLPENADDKTVTWTTSDAAIATVADGVVTAIAPGTAIITATAGDVSATCTVTVKPVIVYAESITLSKTEIEIYIDAEETLTATVSPENTTDKTVTWTTSDATVATVADGVVKGIAEGTATITATCGEVSATCVVTVTIDPASVTLVNADKAKVTGIYSILGVKLREGTSLDNLPAGIYIVNGKKIIKRN